MTSSESDRAVSPCNALSPSPSDQTNLLHRWKPRDRYRDDVPRRKTFRMRIPLHLPRHLRPSVSPATHPHSHRHLTLLLKACPLPARVQERVVKWGLHTRVRILFVTRSLRLVCMLVTSTRGAYLYSFTRDNCYSALQRCSVDCYRDVSNLACALQVLH